MRDGGGWVGAGGRQVGDRQGDRCGMGTGGWVDWMGGRCDRWGCVGGQVGGQWG